MKNRPALRCPRSSLPSTKLNPRRRILIPFSESADASRTCASSGMTGVPFASIEWKLAGSNSPVPPSGAPLPLVRPTIISCSVSDGAIPGLDVHPDAAGDEVGPARHPVRPVAALHPHVLVEQVRFLGLEVVRAVLEAEQVAGVVCWVDVDDVRPYPSCAQRTAVVPKPMRTRLRTACTATCGSFAQAWMQMSPPERAGSSRSPWNAGQVGQRGRAPVGDAELVEERAAEADRHGQRRRRQVERLAGVRGRSFGVERQGAVLRGLEAPGQPLGRSGPLAQHAAGPWPCRWRSGRAR